ncbi:MAG: Hsp70 family protein, partial [Oscillospiraceae bacterium]
PAAPRGVPQIEVTFDIDANGIVHVSAKDLGTGKEQNITITSSTNMDKNDIEKAVKEAEQFAEEDKKRRDAIDTKNGAENMIFQTEKTLGEVGDKVSAEEKSGVEAKLNELKEAIKTDDTENIKAKQKELETVFYELSSKLYQQTQNAQQAPPQGDPNATQQNANNDDFVDADFKEVNDEENK